MRYIIFYDKQIFPCNSCDSCLSRYAVHSSPHHRRASSGGTARLREPNGPSEVSRYWSAGRTVQSARNRVAWRERRLRDSICRSRERVSVDISPREKPVAESARARVRSVCGQPRWLALVGGWSGHPLTRAYVCARNLACAWMDVSCVCGFENLKSDVRECSV